MRRFDRAVNTKEELLRIVDSAEVCRLGFAVASHPYIVPLSFGYRWDEELYLYFHSAREGRKLELMKKNDLVCFELETGVALLKDESPCKWGMRYSSIIGLGLLDEITEEEERMRGFELIMRHYGFTGKNDYSEASLSAATILRLQVTELSGKSSG